MEFEKLAGIIAEVLNIDKAEVRMNSDFVDDLGADSLDVYQIIMNVEDVLQIEIASDDAESIRTVAQAFDLINGMLN